MKTVFYLLLISGICGCLLAGSAVYGQHKSSRVKKVQQDAAYFNTPEDWYKKIEGRPFPLQKSFVAIDGGVIDFTHLERPAIVCFGFAACPPCRHELPIYRAAAAQHPEVDFIYITYDDEETRLKELTSLELDTLPPVDNYHVLHMALPEIDRYSLTLAYPTQYFIRKDGIVTYMQSGGDPDEPVAIIVARIEQLIRNKGRAH